MKKKRRKLIMPHVGLIPAIANLFGVSIDELIDNNTYENKSNLVMVNVGSQSVAHILLLQCIPCKRV